MSDRLAAIQTWLQTEIVPVANQLDFEPEALRRALLMMSDRNAHHQQNSLLGLKVPTESGGAGFTELDYRQFQIMMTRSSGALAFLQTQHQSAVGMLAKSSNKLFQADLFPDVTRGNILVGVGFSHLRRSGLPMLTATVTENGYLLSGEVPWITGYNFFSYFICGAILPDGRELYGLLPFENKIQSQGSITFSPPLELMAMMATNTVSAQINQWFLPNDRLVNIQPPDSIHHSSRQNVLNHGFFALGCAYAGLDILAVVENKKQLNFLQSTWRSLHQEVQQCEKNMMAVVLDTKSTYKEKLNLRIEAISLAQRCSTAGIIASSGAANYLKSSAARVYREALLFSVSGQTTDVMQKSLQKIMKPSKIAN